MDELQLIRKTKRWLKRYKRNVDCIDRLENKLKQIDDRMTSIKSPNLSGMPRGGVPVTIEELLSDKLDLEHRIEKLKKKGRIYKTEILEEIDALDDPRYCEVLESFLIDCIPLDDVAENEGYTIRHIYRLYSEAVEAIAFKRQ